jgi:hypothetical protein
MTRHIFIALAAAMLVSIAAPAFADDYAVNCDQVSRTEWAQCIWDKQNDAGDE